MIVLQLLLPLTCTVIATNVANEGDSAVNDIIDLVFKGTDQFKRTNNQSQPPPAFTPNTDQPAAPATPKPFLNSFDSAYMPYGQRDSWTDFKVMSLFFADAILEGLKIDDQEMEGAKFTQVAWQLSQILKQMPDEKFKSIAEGLELGIRYKDKILQMLSNRKAETAGSLRHKLKTFHQELLLRHLENGKEVIIPSGWNSLDDGHAIVLSLKLQSNDNTKLDVRVFNIGSGVNNHVSIADPNGVYPSLVKPWLSFEGIPYAKLTENHWFTLAEANLYDRKMDQHGTPMEHFYYNDFLFEFAQYMVHNDKALYTVAQRSGTCTMSSLMARVMYQHDNIASYSKSRVQIGLQILKWWKDKHFHSAETKKRAESDHRYLMILRYITSSLAKDAIGMFAPETQMTSYPTMEQIQKLIQEYQSIEKEKINLVRQVAEEGIDLLRWINSFKLKNSEFETETDGQLRLVPGRVKVNTSAIPERRDFKIGTHRTKQLSSYVKVRKQGHFGFREIFAKMIPPVGGMSTLGKNIKIAELTCVGADEVDVKEWMNNYIETFKVFSYKKDRPAVTLDDLLGFLKLSAASWKLAQCTDKGNKEIGLAQISSPFSFCPLTEKFTGKVDIASLNELKAHSNDIFDQMDQFCRDLEAWKINDEPGFFAPEKIFNRGYYNEEKLSAKDHEIVNNLINKGSSAIEDYSKKMGFIHDQKNQISKYVIGWQIEELVNKFPHFYLALTTALTTHVVTNYKFSGDKIGISTPLAYSCDMNMDCRKMKTFVGIFLSNDKYAPDLGRTVKQDLKEKYMNKIRNDMIRVFDEVSYASFTNLVDFSTNIKLFENARFCNDVDKIFFSSRLLDKKLQSRPEFGNEIIETMNGIFQYQLQIIHAAISAGFANKNDTKDHLLTLIEFATIYVRILARLNKIKNRQNASFSKAISEAWSFVHKSLLALGGFSVNVDPDIVDESIFGRINFLLSLSLSYVDSKDVELTKSLTDLYTNAQATKADINSLVAVHFFAAKMFFTLRSEVSSSEIKFVLDELFANDNQDGILCEIVGSDEINENLLEKYLADFILKINGQVVKGSPQGCNGKDIWEFKTSDGSDTYLMRLSTYVILLNGNQFETRVKFTNHKNFRDFFHKDLKAANSGTVRLEGTDMVYSIKDFLVAGADYKLTLNDEKLSIYRRTEGNNYAALIADKSSFDAAFSLKNTGNLRLYGGKDKTSFSLYWMAMNSNEIVFKAEQQGVQLRFESPIIKTGLLSILDTSATSGVPAIFKTFAASLGVNYYQDVDGNLVIIYPLYRFGILAPVAFIHKEGQFVLINDSTLILHDSQVINPTSPFKPSIILRSKSHAGSLIALVPIVDNDAIDSLTTKKIGEQEKPVSVFNTFRISVNSDSKGVLTFMPQSRLENMLLAYHNIYSWNFKEALNQLNIDTIHHNVPFSEEELEMLKKISGMSAVKHPEASALKVMAFAHLLIDAAESQKKVDSDFKKSVTKGLLTRYQNSFRDVSQKYYVHLMFPEILNPELSLLYTSDQKTSKPSLLKAIIGSFSETKGIFEEIYGTSPNPEKTEAEDLNVFDLIGVSMKALCQLSYKQLASFADPTGRFHYETPINDPKVVENWKIITSMIAKDTDEFHAFTRCFTQNYNDPDLLASVRSIEKKIEENRNEYNELKRVSIPWDSLATACKRLDKSIEYKSAAQARTGLEVLLANMENDLAAKQAIRQNQASRLPEKAVATPEDMAIFAKITQEIQTQWLRSAGNVALPSVGGVDSRVLKELNDSMANFAR